MIVVHTFILREWDNFSSCYSLPNFFTHYVSLFSRKHQFVYFNLFVHRNEKPVTCFRPNYLLSHNWVDGMDGLYIYFATRISFSQYNRRLKCIFHPDLIFELGLLLLYFVIFLFLKRRLIYTIDVNNDFSNLFDVLRFDRSNLLHAFELIVFEQISKWMLHKDYSFHKGFYIKLMQNFLTSLLKILHLRPKRGFLKVLHHGKEAVFSICDDVDVLYRLVVLILHKLSILYLRWTADLIIYLLFLLISSILFEYLIGNGDLEREASIWVDNKHNSQNSSYQPSNIWKDCRYLLYLAVIGDGGRRFEDKHFSQRSIFIDLVGIHNRIKAYYRYVILDDLWVWPDGLISYNRDIICI